MANLSNKKAILAVWNTAGRGKTATLRALANLLLQEYPNSVRVFASGPVPLVGGDFRLIMNIDGLVVAVESQGDPNTRLRERLIDLADNWNADVIFCSCRTKGETVAAVENLIEAGFEGVWTSTYQTDRDREAVNTLKGRHILELMQSLDLMPG